MKTKHTPGPWTIVDENELGTVNSEKEPYGIYADGDESVRVAGIMCEYLAPSEVGANAQLIAAAPEMLAALQRVMQLAVSADGDETFEQVKAAIAKATGETK